MGQYYSIVNLSKGERLTWSGGIKLMEFSYKDNDVTSTLANMLEGDWYGDVVVVIGDYAYDSDDYGSRINEIGKKLKIRRRRAANGDLSYNFYNDELFNYPKMKAIEFSKENLYFLNLDKKLYVDRSKLPVSDFYFLDDGYELLYKVEPISLLLALGNGLGGGDFHDSGDGYEFVGAWAGDACGCSKTIPQGFVELKPNFKEY